MKRYQPTLIPQKYQGGSKRRDQICFVIRTLLNTAVVPVLILTAFALVSLTSRTLHAQIVVTGDVTPQYPATSPSVWDISGQELWVGDFGDGSITLNSGSSIISRGGHIGVFGDGQVILDGQSDWTITDGGLELGVWGDGLLEIRGGSIVQVQGDVDVTMDPMVTGQIIVDGNDSLLDVDGSIHFVMPDIPPSSQLVISGGGEVRLTGGLDLSDAALLDFTDGHLRIGGLLRGYEGPINVGSSLTLANYGAEWRVTQPVNVAGTLYGIGEVSDHLTVQAGGHISPGIPDGTSIQQIDTLRLRGGLTADADSNLDITAGLWSEVTTPYDRIYINGTADVNGGTVNIDTIDYVPVGETCPFLQTSQGLTVNTELTHTAPIRFDVTLDYDANDYWFKLTHNPDYYHVIADTDNQRDLADYLEEVADQVVPGSDMADILNEFNHLPDPLARQALEQMGGQGYASNSSQSINMSSGVVSNINSQLRPSGGGFGSGMLGGGGSWGDSGGNGSGGSGSGSGSSGSGDGSGSGSSDGSSSDSQDGSTDDASSGNCECECECGERECEECFVTCDPCQPCTTYIDPSLRSDGYFWTSGFGQGGRIQGDANSHSVDGSGGGVMLGYQSRIDSQTQSGWLYSYNNAQSNMPTLGSSSSIDTHWFGMNSSHVWLDNSYYMTNWMIGTTRYNTERQIQFGSINRVAHGKSNGWQTALYGECGYLGKIGDLHWQPIFGLQYIYSRQNSTVESGAGALNLQVGGIDANSLRSVVGMNLDWSVPRSMLGSRWNPAAVSPQMQFRAAWTHEYIDQTPSFNSTFTEYGGSGFNQSGINLGRDWATLGVEARWQLGPNSYMHFGYDSFFNSTSAYHTGSGGIVFRPRKFPMLIRLSANVGVGSDRKN